MEAKARVAPRSRDGFGLGIAVERDQHARRTERGEDAPAVPATAEGAVDVDAVAPDRQRGHGFIEQDRDMAAIHFQREKPSSSGGRPPGNAIACAVCSVQRASSQSSNLLP